MSRLMLSNKDVQLITGKGRSATQCLVTAIKLKVHKSKYHQLTITEFCEHMRLSVELVLRQLSK